jgi:Ca2+/Na+ antiporter
MSVTLAVAAFLAGALVSLATAWLLVSRLERVGERLGLSEALLGIVAALAADAPEVTAAVSAMAGGQKRLGAGVVIGSNVFNLAALLGLGAVVAGRIGLHRKVVVLGGTVALAVAGVCLAVVLGLVPRQWVVCWAWSLSRCTWLCLGFPAGAWPGWGFPSRGLPGCGRRWLRRRQSWSRRSGLPRDDGQMWLLPPCRWWSWSWPA